MRNYFALKNLRVRRKNNLWILLETIVITAATLAICYLIKPKNPLFLHGIFPWPWLASLIMVLRYGFGPGFLAAALISAAAIFTGPPGAIIIPDYQNYILSCFGLTFFCGLFSSGLTRRCINAEELLAYSQEKLDSLSRSYYLMHISHNNLEKNLITQPITVRSVIETLQKLLIKQEGALTTDLAYQFLQLVCQNCSVSIAGIYRYGNQGLEENPLAEIGNMEPLNRDDPVLTQSIKNQATAYIRSDLPGNTYLIATPMLGLGDKPVAMLIIKAMAFKALTADTLRVLNILVSYFIEEFTMNKDFLAVLSQYPDCPPQFAKELQKLLSLKRKMNIDSGLSAVIIAKNLQAQNVIDNLKLQQRTLDTTWLHESAHFDVLITLMPLTNAEGINGYFNRIGQYLKASLGLTVDQQQIKTRSLQLMPISPDLMMQKFLSIIEAAAC